MGTLVLVLIGLTVFSYFCAAGLGYINPDIFSSMIDEYKIKQGISSISSSVGEYDLVNSEYPENISNLIDGKYISNTPNFPNDINILKFNSNGANFYFCLHGDSVKEREYKTYKSIMSENQKLTLVSDCDTGIEDTDPQEFPASLTFRYNYNN